MTQIIWCRVLQYCQGSSLWTFIPPLLFVILWYYIVNENSYYQCVQQLSNRLGNVWSFDTRVYMLFVLLFSGSVHFFFKRHKLDEVRENLRPVRKLFGWWGVFQATSVGTPLDLYFKLHVPNYLKCIKIFMITRILYNLEKMPDASVLFNVRGFYRDLGHFCKNNKWCQRPS